MHIFCVYVSLVFRVNFCFSVWWCQITKEDSSLFCLCQCFRFTLQRLSERLCLICINSHWENQDKMAALISENFKFVALFFKSKDVMIFNGLIGLGTVASQTAFNIFAFNCPCSPKKNYLYGLTAIGVPALAFFVIGVMLNRNTWDVVSECRTRRCRKLSLSAAFALLGSILGRAVVAPVTWSVISLLRGEAYVCALSEFVDPSSLDHFPPTTKTPEIMARFPCNDVPAPLMNYSRVIERQLKYESQVFITVI